MSAGEREGGKEGGREGRDAGWPVPVLSATFPTEAAIIPALRRPTGSLSRQAAPPEMAAAVRTPTLGGVPPDLLSVDKVVPAMEKNDVPAARKPRRRQHTTSRTFSSPSVPVPLFLRCF